MTKEMESKVINCAAQKRGCEELQGMEKLIIKYQHNR